MSKIVMRRENVPPRHRPGAAASVWSGRSPGLVARDGPLLPHMWAHIAWWPAEGGAPAHPGLVVGGDEGGRGTEAGHIQKSSSGLNCAHSTALYRLLHSPAPWWP